MSLGGRPSQRKGLSLSEERAMLAKLHETVRMVSPEEYRRAMRERLGVAHLDQFLAASRDAERAVRREEASSSRWVNHVQTSERETAVALLAGVVRCHAHHHCRHAAPGDRPLFAYLAARVIACGACLPRFLRVIAAQDARVRAGRDRTCDLCLREADHFRPIQVAFGPARVFGDACDACWGTVERGAVAA